MARHLLKLGVSSVTNMLSEVCYMTNSESVSYYLSRRCQSDVSNISNADTSSEKVSINRIITLKDIRDFSHMTGDSNPIHLIGDKNKAVVQGAFLNGLVSGVIGSHLPGAVVVSQVLRFPNSCYAGDQVVVTVNVPVLRKIITCTFKCVVTDRDRVVLEGEVKLLIPQ